MKKLLMLFSSLAVSLSSLNADVSLRHLIEYDKEMCLEKLEQATTEELWDVFLEGQAELFFEPEFQWIASQSWWTEVTNILEFGSGNGAYLSKLSDQFHEKNFFGIEKLSLSVKQANERYAKDKIKFQEGDAEIFNEQLSNSAEVVLFRLTLQHLKKPLLALQNAWDYLHSNGYVLIIDSCDSAKKTSHPITAINKALELVAESQRNNGIGNRQITLEILQMIENQQPPLSEFYKLIFSNVDTTGKVIYENIRLEGERVRERYFNHNLLFVTLLHRTYHVQIDIQKAYDELKEYLEDEHAWTVLGMHYLVLKKK